MNLHIHFGLLTTIFSFDRAFIQILIFEKPFILIVSFKDYY